MDSIELEARWAARNYDPMPVVLTRGDGAFLWDADGHRYVDMMSAYSAVSHGHAHPRILAALEGQARRLAVCSRAYHTDRLGAFLAKLCQVTGMDRALPMNTGAEAVETAIKAARRWGYRVKGIAAGRAEIIVAALTDQARRLAVPSRAFHNDRLGPFLAKLCALTGLDAALPMNTGAEAVETAIKAARRWGYRVKGIAPDRARIIVADGNFHGRTTTIVGFSSEESYRDGFGPFTPGFRAVPFGDLEAMRRAITPETAAILI